MSDSAERLAVAIRDLIKEVVEYHRVHHVQAPTDIERLPAATLHDEGPPRRRLYPVAEAREQLGGISRTTLWSLTARGDLEAVKLGRRTFIPATSLDEFVQRLRAARGA